MSPEGPERGSPGAAALSEVASLLGGETGTSRTFLGGLIVGALVGAALAGTALVRSRAADRVLRVLPKR